MQFHPGEKKYQITSLNETVVRSYLDDVETNYTSSLGITDITSPPPDCPPNRLVVVRIDGRPVGSSQVFESSIERPIKCVIKKDGSCKVDYKMERWVQAEAEPNAFTPRRYTQLLQVQFENLLGGDQEVNVKFTEDGTNWKTERLSQGTLREVARLEDCKPRVQAFDYRILAPLTVGR